jgi:pimeloyl-ACP methyl ester carboxylesterase
MNTIKETVSQYANINGLKMYYEMSGEGDPLVLLHGGGSTILTTYARVIPQLRDQFQVIAVELQAHGRTADIDRPLSFEQDADDVAELLKQLEIPRAGFIGFSNGGTTCLQLAIRHPQLVKNLVLASALFERAGMQPGFFEGMQHASMEQMPQPLKEAFIAVNPDPAALTAMFKRDVARMNGFEGISAELIANIKAPSLVINGDRDVVTIEHAVRICTLISDSRLMILPCGHGDYFQEICTAVPDQDLLRYTISTIVAFLNGTLH